MAVLLEIDAWLAVSTRRDDEGVRRRLIRFVAHHKDYVSDILWASNLIVFELGGVFGVTIESLLN